MRQCQSRRVALRNGLAPRPSLLLSYLCDRIDRIVGHLAGIALGSSIEISYHDGEVSSPGTRYGWRDHRSYRNEARARAEVWSFRFTARNKLGHFQRSYR